MNRKVPIVRTFDFIISTESGLSSLNSPQRKDKMVLFEYTGGLYAPIADQTCGTGLFH